MSPSLSRPARAELLRSSVLYLCTDARTEHGGLDALAAFVDAAYRGGVDIIQLRDKTLPARDEIAALKVLADVARRHGKLFAVNDRADIAAIVGADVFHVGQTDLSPSQARRIVGPDVLIGRSNNSVEQWVESMEHPDVDYAVIGPVWPTPTKPGRPAVGLETVRAVARHDFGPTTGPGTNPQGPTDTALAGLHAPAAHGGSGPSSPAGHTGAISPAPGVTDRSEPASSPLASPPAPCHKPWFAIGSISQATVTEVVEAGAPRIVVVRAITGAADPQAAAAQLRQTAMSKRAMP